VQCRAEQVQHLIGLILVGVGLGFLGAAWSPAKGRHALEITVEVLQHMDEFMADQLPAHLSAHRPLLEADGAQAAVFRPVAGVLSRELGWVCDHLHTYTPSRLPFRRSSSLMDGSALQVRPPCGPWV